MKIDTSILRNELTTPVTICGSEEFKRGWHSCAEELEKAIQRAERKTPQEEDDEDRGYWKGRAEGLEYAVDALQSIFELISNCGADMRGNDYQRHIEDLEHLEQKEEDILKFYYVESLDEYWIGQRCGTRYYGKWTGNCFTFTHSRYLPWGEHVVAPDTLWKEHTYPSEPKEIPFNEWLQGFLRKECPPVEPKRPKGEWIDREQCQVDEDAYDVAICSNCKAEITLEYPNDNYCPNCGADMRGNDYQRHIEDLEHFMRYEPTYNPEDGSM